MFKPLFRTPLTSIVTIVASIIAAYILTWFTLTCAIPLAQGDGVGNFTGIKQELAAKLTSFTHDAHSPSPAPGFSLQVHADDVHLTTDAERTQYCHIQSWITKDPTNIAAYTTVITMRSLGSWQVDNFAVVGCDSDAGILNKFFGHRRP